MELGVTAVMLPEIDFAAQVELCSSLDVRFYQYRPRWIAASDRNKPCSPWGNHCFDLTPELLAAEGPRFTAALEDAGLRPWGTLPAVSTDDTDETIALHLRGAAAAGAGRMRLSPGPYPPGAFDYGSFLGRTVDRYQGIIRGIARPLGIRLLVETHAGGAAASPGLAWNIVRGMDPSDIGVIFDLGNFAREGEVRSALAVSILRDWIDCVHVGGSRRIDAGRDERGCRLITHESCSLEDSDLHIHEWIAAIRDAGVDAPLIIEDFAPAESGPERLRRDAKFLHGLLSGGGRN